MWLVVSLVDSTIKLSRRNCFVFVPRQSNCSPLIAKTKKTFGISTCDTYYSFPPLPSCVNPPPALPLFLHCPPIVHTTNNHARFTHSRYPSPMYVFPHCCLPNNQLTFSSSTRSDNGRTSTPCTKHCVAYAARFHFPYHPQPFRQSLYFTIEFAL